MRQALANGMMRASRRLLRRSVLVDAPGYTLQARALDYCAGWLAFGSVVLSRAEVRDA